MKVAIVFVALFATCAAMDASKIMEIASKGNEIYEKCLKNLQTQTLYNLAFWGGHDDKETNCARKCIMELVGTMADKKINMPLIEEKMNACPVLQEHPAVKDTMLKVYKSCQKTAEAGADECEVAGKWSQCFKDLMMNMAIAMLAAMKDVIDKMPPA